MISWADMTGRTAGGWLLDTFLGERNDKAFFIAVHSENQQTALMETIAAETEGAPILQRSWQLAKNFDNPHLLRVFATGETTIDRAPVYYAAMDLPDDDVSERLQKQAIPTKEAVTITSAVAAGLRFLHGQGLSHGGPVPANIFFVGNAVKLSADTISPADSEGQGADLRSFGGTLVEMIRRETDPQAAFQLPPPLGEIAVGCLALTGEQWTADRVIQKLSEPAPVPVKVAATAATASVASASAPPPLLPPRRTEPAARPVSQYVEPVEETGGSSRFRMAAIGCALIVVLAFVYMLTRPSKVAAPPTAAPVAATTEQVPAPVPAVTKPAPQTSQAPVRSRTAAAAPKEHGGAWAVIAATYASHSAAQQRANSISRRAPKLKAHAYPPAGQAKLYYVVLASGISQKEADETRRMAVRMGAPRDTYVTKLSEQ